MERLIDYTNAEKSVHSQLAIRYESIAEIEYRMGSIYYLLAGKYENADGNKDRAILACKCGYVRLKEAIQHENMAKTARRAETALLNLAETFQNIATIARRDNIPCSQIPSLNFDEQLHTRMDGYYEATRCLNDAKKAHASLLMELSDLEAKAYSAGITYSELESEQIVFCHGILD